jgi:hypothetical protein
VGRQERINEVVVVSKLTLSLLPDIPSLKKLSQSLAVLDAILSPEWEYRYYSFDSKWAPGETMASMRNGSGDEYFILFDAVGAAIKGFDHESDMSPWADAASKPWPGVIDEVPKEFSSFLAEPAFSINDSTFCLWRKHEDSTWQVGNIDYPPSEDPDGSAWMLKILDGSPSTYREFAEDYYARKIEADAVNRIYRHEPATAAVVQALNPDMTLRDLRSDIEEIGFPIKT